MSYSFVVVLFAVGRSRRLPTITLRLFTVFILLHLEPMEVRVRKYPEIYFKYLFILDLNINHQPNIKTFNQAAQPETLPINLQASHFTNHSVSEQTTIC